VYDRFVELEQFEYAFRKAAYKLIQRARKHSNGLVGHDAHIDGTEAETQARLQHICGANCPRKLNSDGTTKKRGPAQLPERLATESVRAIRHQQTEKSPEDLPPLSAGSARKVIHRVDEKTGQTYLLVQDKHGCWYRSFDTTAGARSYAGPRGSFRYWHGYYNIKAIDHYTGGVLDVFVMDASINEHFANDVVVDRIKEALGDTPRALCYDKGFSIESVYKHNTLKGIATVAPFRRGRFGNRADYDTNRYDRHGVPRCKHCGGEGRFLSFLAEPKPRLIYTCGVGCDASKRADGSPIRMSINCEEKWRFLVPLWRTSEAYMALKLVGKSYEGVHRYWRDRYKVGGTDYYTRPKRIGKEWQQLRASAAMLAEWIKICWREGWLGSARRNTNFPRTNTAASALSKFLAYRVWLGLDKEATGQLPIKIEDDEDVGMPPPDDGPPDLGDPPGFVASDDFPF